MVGSNSASDANFNPRSHEGSDISRQRLDKMYKVISIHAPTRGATRSQTCDGADAHISIHAPTRGATQKELQSCSIPVISIHAPTRGATVLLSASPSSTRYFNPRSHEGSDSNFRQKVLFSLSKNCLKYLILTTNYFN